MKTTKTQTMTPEIFDTQKDAIAKIASLFPQVVKDGSVDFALLKRELDGTIDDSTEKYRFTWTGKENARQLANEDVFGRTLQFVPEESKNADTTGNLFIEGDNLEVLKLLRQNYYAAIKMIYIDPPYNTGNDFIYRDNFTKDEAESELEEGNITAEGERLVRNQRSSNRFHANWLNMMYPRLRVARDLLTADGLIFISIDDNEVANLRKVCDEIFGEQNFVGNIAWESKTKSQNTTTAFNKLQPKVEHLLLYTRGDCRRFNLIQRGEKEYPLIDEQGVYREHVLEVMNATGIRGRESMVFEIDGITPPLGKQWQIGQDLVATYKNSGNLFTRQEKVIIKMRPENERTETTEPFWGFFSKDIGTAESAKKELNELLGNHGFETIKPMELIKRLVYHATSPTDIVLDFFSGSCTTAHAVMALNAEDGGNRKFIMVQIPEKCDEKSEAAKAGYKTICDIGKERVRRAGEKIVSEQHSSTIQPSLLGEAELAPSLDTGFKVFKTDDTMIRWTHAMLTDDRSVMNESFQLKAGDKDGVDFMPHFTDIDVAYEILLRQHDIPLSAKMEHLSNIGKRTWCFADRYVVCLEEKITVKLLEKLAEIDPVPFKYVFRDSAFGDDIALKDETIRRLAALVAKNTGETKKVYTVEFL